MAEPSNSDAHTFTIDGRRWRKTDPGIPEALRSELVKQLMHARRAVKAAKANVDSAAERLARARVADAKLALGERGAPWWERANDAQNRQRAEATVRALLRQRGEDKTICPSDVARVLAGTEFRSVMKLVRNVVNGLAAQGAVEVRQRGVRTNPEMARGPIRVALVPPVVRAPPGK